MQPSSSESNGATPPTPRATQLRVKVGGVTRPEDAALAGSLGAWAVCVHLAPKDPRFVNADEARPLFAALPAGVQKVGLFRNQSAEVVNRVADELGLDLIELAGHETDDVVQAVGAQRVIKTVVIHELIGVTTVLGYGAAYLQIDKASVGTQVIQDTVDPKIAALLTERFEQTLIGGPLEPADVAEYWQTARPWGINVTHGVEPADAATPGPKDADKLRALFAAIDKLGSSSECR